jgi:hypothetical protein
MLTDSFKMRVPEATDKQAEYFLGLAGDVINIRRQTNEVEEKYRRLQVEIAIELFNKIGAEGQTRHSENGIDRTFATTMVSRTLLSQIIPRAVVY